MKVKSLQIQNFLSFGGQTQSIEFDNVNTIVGPNNSGKTNIFRAISLVGEILENYSIDTHLYHQNGDLSKDFDIKVSVKFDPEEIAILSEFLTCSLLIKQINATAGENSKQIDELYRMLIVKNKGLFDDLFQNVDVRIQGRGLETYPNSISLRLGNEENALFAPRENLITSADVPEPQLGNTNFGDYLWNKLKKENTKKVEAFLTGKSDEMPDVTLYIRSLSQLLSQEQFGIRGHWPLSIESFGFESVDFKLGKVPELLHLRRYMEKRKSLRKGITLFSIISAIFNDAIVRVSDARNRPQAVLPHSTLDFTGSEFNLMTGKDLPLTLFKLKNSSDPSLRKRYKLITGNFEKLFDSEVDIQIVRRIVEEEPLTGPPYYSRGSKEALALSDSEESEEVKDIIDDLFILIIKDNLVLPVEFAAAGITEILLLLVALIGFQHKVILLDEPALNLHPTFQRKLDKIITETSSSNENQIVLITHSPFLVDSARLRCTWKISKQNNITEVLNLGKLRDEIDSTLDEKITLDLRNADTRSLLFSQGAILVEGPSDKIVIEKVNRYLSRDDESADIETNEWVVIDINGKNSLGKYFYLCERLGVPIIAIVDYDALMERNATIDPSYGKINTSQVFYNLYINKYLSSEDLRSLHTYNEPVVYIKNRKNIDCPWYPSSRFPDLFEIAKKYHVFVFGSDLEGVLQTPGTTKKNKPLKNFETVQILINKNKVPGEFISMTLFLKKHMIR